jgi:hypothetical protein
MCCECNGCATSTRRFVYFDDFPGNADLAVTYWIDYDNGMDLGILVPDGCEEFDVDFKVRNFGSAASLPFESRITAIPRDGGDPVTLWSGSSSGLAVNGTYEGTATIAIPWLPSHRAYLAFEADWDEAVQ